MEGQDQTASLLASIVQEFEGLVKQLWVYAQRNPDADFSSLEQRAQQLRSECFASALEAAAELHRTRVEEEWLLGKVDCECGQRPQYKGKQRRTIQTWVGSVTLERGYFYCKECRTGRYPLDEALGIPAGEHFSEGVQQGVCLVGVQMPFEGASHVLQVLSGICVSSRETERMTEQRGLALERELQAQDQHLLLTPVTTLTQTVGGCGCGCGSDGEIEGGKATRQSYIAECGSMEAAGARLSAEAYRRGVGHEEKVVCLGDGAPSNWTQFDEHFPNRVEVLDWYHAMEHMWAAGNGLFGQGTPQAVKWVKRWEKALWEGRVEGVIMALHRESKREGAEGEAAREQIHYFETNRERMRYSDYRALGYPIGSGTVESACKRLIGARMKGAGMCWGKRGAQGVLTLRAELLSGRWEQSWPNTRITKVA
ncbi:MAG: ISKra4 family transposase [Chloroflexi bacterium]|nr:ISKra4 family transposase [Chloroflexota bacterium]